MQLLTKTKQSKCSILNATITLFSQIRQFFAKSSQIFTVKTVNRRRSSSVWPFVVWTGHIRCLRFTLRFCRTVLYDNTVDVDKASENTKNNIGLWMFIENIKQTRRILHKISTTFSAIANYLVFINTIKNWQQTSAIFQDAWSQWPTPYAARSPCNCTQLSTTWPCHLNFKAYCCCIILPSLKITWLPTSCSSKFAKYTINWQKFTYVLLTVQVLYMSYLMPSTLPPSLKTEWPSESVHQLRHISYLDFVRFGETDLWSYNGITTSTCCHQYLSQCCTALWPWYWPFDLDLLMSKLLHQLLVTLLSAHH